MSTRTIGVVIAAVAAVIGLCIAGPAILIGGAGTAACLPAGPASSPGTPPPVAGWDADQVTNAHVIVSVGARKAIPPRGWVIAVATAMQESGLRNLPGGDRDSIGLFQQRPSQGWGPPGQLTDPAYAAAKFYDKLLTIAGWQTMPLTKAAQQVQTSAYPHAYAKWEDDATTLVNRIAFNGIPTISLNLEQCLSHCPETASTSGPAGATQVAARCQWVAPVRAPIVSGFRTTARPGHDGVDLGAARGTPIRAASGGTVLLVRCNVVPASHGCDRDGSPSTPGCGWYLDLLHAGQVVTRYCHMLNRPTVGEGQQVATGQVVGLVGSSGHSSGPDLHFEVHLNADRSPAGAVDPVAFMASRAPLGLQ